MTEKEKLVKQIMDLLEGSYTKKSMMYKTTKLALRKLTGNELSGLYSMLLCQVKTKTLLEHSKIGKGLNPRMFRLPKKEDIVFVLPMNETDVDSITLGIKLADIDSPVRVRWIRTIKHGFEIHMILEIEGYQWHTERVNDKDQAIDFWNALKDLEFNARQAEVERRREVAALYINNNV